MKNPSTTVLVWGVYLALVGTGFLALPDLVLGMLSFAPAGDFWVRVLGILAVLTGYYHIRAARAGLTPFYGWTVHGRLFAAAAMTLLALLGTAPTLLLLLAGVELLGALWTLWALRAG